MIMVYNKCDKLTEEKRDDNSIYISARTGEGVEKLKKTIMNKLF